jgi:hypothetical protein
LPNSASTPTRSVTGTTSRSNTAARGVESSTNTNLPPSISFGAPPTGRAGTSCAASIGQAAISAASWITSRAVRRLARAGASPDSLTDESSQRLCPSAIAVLVP